MTFLRITSFSSEYIQGFQDHYVWIVADSMMYMSGEAPFIV